MKKIIFLTALILLTLNIFSQGTKFIPTQEKFSNGELVYQVVHHGGKVGEFWPIKSVKLITNETNPDYFKSSLSIETILEDFKGVAVVPGGMTGQNSGAYQMLGRNLSQGKICGDRYPYRYGIICFNENGDSILFTHKDEINNFDSLYNLYKRRNGNILFLPSIFRNGNYLSSEKVVDKVLVRRDTPAGPQIGVIIFDNLVTYNQVREIILGLDRPGMSKTTHIYMLDGGPLWGQSCRETETPKVFGSRNPDVVTNYLIIY